MYATAAGSLPGADFAGALRAMAELFPELVPWPELPARGVGSDLIGRALGLIDGLGFDLQPAGWRLTQHTGRDQRRAASQWRHDLDDAEEILQDFDGGLKVAIAGPWTLAACVERPMGDRLLADHGARREVAQALHAAALTLIAELRRRLPRVALTLQIDEPSVIAVAEGRIPTASGFGKHRGVEVAELSGVLRDLGELDVQSVLHCCAPGRWLPLARVAHFDGVAIDATLMTDSLSRDDLTAWLGEGHLLLAGVVDTATPVMQRTDDLVRRALELLRPLELDPDLVAAQTILSTACGLAGWDAADITPQLRALGKASSLVAEQLAR